MRFSLSSFYGRLMNRRRGAVVDDPAGRGPFTTCERSSAVDIEDMENVIGLNSSFS